MEPNVLSSKKLVSVLKGAHFKSPPRWFMRQAGRYLPEYKIVRSKFPSFKEFLFSTSDIKEVTLQPLRRFDLDAAIIFSDILTVPMLMGIETDVLENVGPQLNSIKTTEEVARLELPYSYSLCHPIYEAIEEVKSALDPTKALIGFAGGPWTLASYILEGKTSKTFTITRTFAYRHPDAFKKLLDIISDITAQHLIYQIKAGADVIKIFDSWASAVPFHKINDWLIEPHKRIVQQVREVYPDIPILGFTKGREDAYIRYIQAVSVDGVALGTTTDLGSVSRSLPSQTALQGALDPTLLIAGGEEMISTIEQQLEIFRDRPYIFNLGHGILPETPIENVDLALQTLDRLCA